MRRGRFRRRHVAQMSRSTRFKHSATLFLRPTPMVETMLSALDGGSILILQK
jgi:hypothetical protein